MYLFLNKPGEENLVENEDIETGKVLRDEKIGRYVFCENAKQMAAYILNQQNPQVHEVICPNTPVKLFFDLDIYHRDITQAFSLAAYVCDQIYAATCLTLTKFDVHPPFSLTPRDFFVFLTSEKKREACRDILFISPLDRETLFKLGIHVIVPKIVFSDLKNLHDFVLHMQACFTDETKAVVDMLYSQFKNLRTPFSEKNGYVKKLITHQYQHIFPFECEYWNMEKHEVLIWGLLTYIPEQSVIIEVEPYDKRPQRELDFNSEDFLTSSVWNKLMGSFDFLESFIERSRHEGTIFLNRISASMCPVCRRLHEHENAFIKVIYSNKIYYYFYCFRNLKQSFLLLEIEIEKDLQMKEEKKQEFNVKQIICGIQAGGCEDESSQNLFKYGTFIADVDEVTLDSPTIFIRGETGIGKTEKIMRKIRRLENFSTLKVIYLSYRKSLTNNIAARFPEFEFVNYLDEGKIVQGNNLIIQVEALNRINLASYDIDFLLIDDVNHVLMQFGSARHCRTNNCSKILFKLIEMAKFVVCADCFLTDFGVRIINSVRKQEQKIYLVHPKTWPQKEYTVYDCFSAFVTDMVTYAKTSKVVLACTSLLLGYGFKEIFSTIFPQKKIIFYCSKTPTKKKNEHMRKIDEIWSTFDIIIYTGAITSGVSSLIEVDRVWGVFLSFGKQGKAEEFVQMLSRCRRADKYSVFITKKTNNLIVDPIEIFKRMENKGEMLTNIKMYWERVDVFSECWVFNEHLTNLTNNSPIKRICQILFYYGVKIETNLRRENTFSLKAIMAAAKSGSIDLILENIATYERETDPEILEMLEDTFIDFGCLQAFYNDFFVINEDFLTNYSSKANLLYFKHLSEYFSKTSDITEAQKQADNEKILSLILNHDVQTKIIMFYSRERKIQNIEKILRLLGLRNLFDQRRLKQDWLFDLLQKKKDYLTQLFNSHLIFNLIMRPVLTKNTGVKALWTEIKREIKNYFGFTFFFSRKDDGFYLRPLKLFDYVPYTENPKLIAHAKKIFGPYFVHPSTEVKRINRPRISVSEDFLVADLAKIVNKKLLEM